MVLGSTLSDRIMHQGRSKARSTLSVSVTLWNIPNGKKDINRKTRQSGSRGDTLFRNSCYRILCVGGLWLTLLALVLMPLASAQLVYFRGFSGVTAELPTGTDLWRNDLMRSVPFESEELRIAYDMSTVTTDGKLFDFAGGNNPGNVTSADVTSSVEFEFDSRSDNDTGSNQAVAYDGANFYGTHIKYEDSPALTFPYVVKMDSNFQLLIERDASTDGPPEFNEESGGVHPQLNGIWAHLDDKLYISAMNWPNWTTPLSWVFVYNKSDLEFQTYYTLPTLPAGSGFSEGIFMDELANNWWVHYFGTPRLERLNLSFGDNTTFMLPSNDLGGDSENGYDGGQWYKGKFYGNVHEGSNLSQVGCASSCMHEYSFNGTAFTALRIVDPPTAKTTQGFDILGSIAYFAERNFAGDENRIVIANIVIYLSEAVLYPTPVYNVVLGEEDPATTTHTVDIPTAPVSDEAAGNILVAVLVWSASTTCTFPGDWTRLVGGSAASFCYGIKASSAESEPADIEITSGASVRSSWGSYRVFGDTFVETGTLDDDDPPSLDITSPAAERVGSAADSARNVLWVVIHFAEDPTDDPRCTAAPTDYGNFEINQTGAGAGYTAYCTADRELQASLENPDTWSIDGTATYRRSATWAFWWESQPPNFIIQEPEFIGSLFDLALNPDEDKSSIQYVTTGYTGSGEQEFSVVFWGIYQFNLSVDGNETIAARTQIGTDWFIQIDSSQNLNFTYCASTTVSVSLGIVNESFHGFGISVGSTVATVFLDGVEVGNGTVNSSEICASGSPLDVGRNADVPTSTWSGTQDEFLYFTTSLDDSTMQELTTIQKQVVIQRGVDVITSSVDAIIPVLPWIIVPALLGYIGFLIAREVKWGWEGK